MKAFDPIPGPLRTSPIGAPDPALRALMNFPRILTLLLLLVSCRSGAVGLHPDPVGGAALQGYDPVSYFPEGGGEPLRGRPEFEIRRGEQLFRFASEAHRARFQEAPERYEPLYGGWCAYAMADGERVDIDPRSYLVTEAGLLLFYDGLWGDTRAMWLEEGPDELKRRADEAWVMLLESDSE